MALPGSEKTQRLIGLALVVGLFITAGLLLYSSSSSRGKPTQLADEVTIKDSVSGEEWTMARGRMLNAARALSAEGKLRNDVGLLNPKTGKRTAFPVDRKEWEALVQQMNAEREADNKLRGIATPGS